MKSILVTGAAGFIGSHTCEALLQNGYKIIGIDNLNDYYDPKIKKNNLKQANKHPNFSFKKIDIRYNRKLQNLFKLNAFDKVIHLAARAGVRPSLNDPRLYFDVNVNGTLNLLELAKEHKIKHFIFASSSSVYGENKKVPFSETDRTDRQVSPYAASKKSCELICKIYSHLYDMSITCLRFFTVYGPRGRPDLAAFKFIDLIHNNKAIEMYGNGSSKRDYTFISDIVQGIIASVEKEFKFEIINLGNSDPITLLDFISIIEDTVKKKAKVQKKPMPKGDVPMTYADIKKAKKLLGYDPKYDIKKGMKELYEWYLSEFST